MHTIAWGREGGASFLKNVSLVECMYLVLPASQVGVTVGNPGFWCCDH